MEAQHETRGGKRPNAGRRKKPKYEPLPLMGKLTHNEKSLLERVISLENENYRLLYCLNKALEYTTKNQRDVVRRLI